MEHTPPPLTRGFRAVKEKDTATLSGAGLWLLWHSSANGGRQIFPSGGFLGGWLKGARQLFRPKFSAAVLREAIGAVVGDQPFGASRCRLIIPAYDVDQGRIYLFKTAHHPRFQFDVRVPAADVALATSAAPTFFPAHRIEGHGTYIDGGVWANCPVLVGLTEAVTFLEQAPEDVRLLSVSTTNYPFRIADAKRLGGILNWNSTLIETLMFGQAQGALAQAACILRRGRFHRIDYTAEPRLYSLGNARLVEELVVLGRGVALRKEHLDEVVRPHFLDGNVVAKFTPAPALTNH